MPDIDGDVIGETLLGQSGFLYFSYTHLSYEWYDPLHYKAKDKAGSVHGMKAPKNARSNSGVLKGPGMSSKAN
jgi:hypothetical protein